MKKFIGVKIVSAKPRQATEDDRRGKHPVGADGYHVVYPDGYESWCPKEEFEKANRETIGMTFGLAIEALKKGFKVARGDKFDADRYIVLSRPALVNIMEAPNLCFVLVKKCGFSQAGWMPTNCDMLSDDWQIVE